ncbi:MAG: aspartate-semialdehyde dehydrogenase [bacterium]
MSKHNVAVVGATGMVGKEMLKILDERKFPIGELKLLASKRSAGMKTSFQHKEYTIEETKPDSFENVEIALFSSSEAASGVFASEAVKRGTVVIDNSSTFRMNPEVPLVVPEVNPQDIEWNKGIIANPNCSTIQLVVVLKPIHDAAKIKRIVVSTYQSVSGWGREAMEELQQQTRDIMEGKTPSIKKDILPHQIAFNVIPHIDKFLDDGYTKEEMKMVNETMKIMNDDTIRVTATCVRVPVFVGHAEAVNIETEKKLSAKEARELLSKAPGVEVVDDPASLSYPLPIMSAGKDPSYVGRIREDSTVPNGLNLWVVSDNLRKGAALNAVQIAELLIKKK